MLRPSLIEVLATPEVRRAMDHADIEERAGAHRRYFGSDAALAWALSVGTVSNPELAALQPPIPPLELREITAAAAADTFLLRGLVDASAFVDAYNKYCRPDSFAIPRVLDFACGCARIARYIAQWNCELYGCDINPSLVAWCQDNLPQMNTTLSATAAPLPFEPGFFDFVYCYSLFTHTAESVARSWLQELRRVTAPGAIVAFTTNGLAWIDSVSSRPALIEKFGWTTIDLLKARATVEAGGFHNRPYPNSPDGYGLSFVAPERVAAQWIGPEYTIAAQRPGRKATIQDLTVLVAID